MKLSIKGESFPIPNQDGEKGPTGAELVAIEDHYGLDAITLLSVMAGGGEKLPAIYTRTKAMYAMAWIILTRAGKVYSLQDVLNEFALDDFEMVEEEEEAKKEVANLSAAE